MPNALGITQDGLKTALEIKDDYRHRRPLVLPYDKTRMLIPENLMNHNIDLKGFEDPLPLAMVASRDPEAPMALAAAARLCPLGGHTKLITGVMQVVGETSRHPLVRECLNFVTESDFDPTTIAEIRRHASRFIVKTREQYTQALRLNLQSLLEGDIAPRQFVAEFFELTEAGNMRNDIREKLVLSLLLSGTVRPSVKFLMLENFERLAKPVRMAIISSVLKAEPTRHTEIIKEELKYMVAHEMATMELG
ncbi:MAG: hypothetical protein O3B76_00315 [Proteobacteria bacterium]|nr:hypothetical protein [Pseudomonadota bacterium]MDA1021863.1 hypothetical protein [Pseudomonadota bacterium]